jgi:hypothetical protein
MATTKPTSKPAPKVSQADKAKAAKVRATLPMKKATDDDVMSMAKSLSVFNSEISKARSF